MTIYAFRIMQSKYLAMAFDGEGAKRYGGRWNSVGTRVIYTAGSLSLATLELLVHTEDYSVIFDCYSMIPIEFKESLAIDLDPNLLPKGWNSPLVISQTQIIGDTWVSEMTSVVLRVPSAVTKRESNYLINPEHMDFNKITIGSPFDFKLDTRLNS